MPDHCIACIGDLLVEMMRPRAGDRLDTPGIFLGPFASGASGIFIDAAAKLGMQTRFIGSVGNDDFGRMITAKLQADNVDISHIKLLDDFTTGVAFVTYFPDGSRKFIFHLADAATGQIYPRDIDPQYLKNLSYLHVIGSTLSTNENCKASCLKAMEFTLHNGGKISFDPNFRPELVSKKEIAELFLPVIKKCHILFPTEEEIFVLTGMNNPDKACENLLTMGPEIIAVKQGSGGSTVYTRNEKYHSPAFKVNEIDPTGAGDCYCAGFLCAFLEGNSLPEAALFANAVAALSVTQKGPMEGIPTREEADKLIRGR